MLKYLRYNIGLSMLVLFSNMANSQENFPTGYFGMPLDIKPYLSGTFGEIRSDHFHTGIDFKTQGVQGKNVYAVADGYISRIKISPHGYGKAVYVTHPNSYVSVYAHLKRYNDDIDSFVKKIQYQTESYAFDKTFSPEEMPLKKGDVIGYSGNTGSSGGPHLHFEIREEKSQYPINPVLCGYDVTDNIPPSISLVKLYVMDDYSSIDHKSDDMVYPVSKTNGVYKISGTDTIALLGNISFGISTFDRLNGANNKNGVYSIELYVDSVCLWSYRMTKLSFFLGRYVNALIDYDEYVRNRRLIERSWISENNHLMIYDQVSNSGTFNFVSGEIYNINYKVADHFGNSSQLHIVAKGGSDAGNNNNGFHKLKRKGVAFLTENENSFENEDIIIKIPANTLYEDIIFEYSSENRCKTCFSKIHHVHNIYTPLHRYFELMIKPDTLIPVKHQSKVLIGRLNEKGRVSSIGGEWNEGYVYSKTRNFGDYALMLDTVAPEIKAINIFPGKELNGQNTIKLRIEDKLSGINSYRATLNGKWILMEYNVNDDMIVYNFDDRIIKGKNDLRVIVTDNKDNISEYNAALYLK